MQTNFFNRIAKPLFARVVVVVILATMVLGQSGIANAATYTWAQNNWSGGATANTAIHPTDDTGWNQYETKTANVAAVNGGNAVQIAQKTGAVAQGSSDGSLDTPNAGGLDAGLIKTNVTTDNDRIRLDQGYLRDYYNMGPYQSAIAFDNVTNSVWVTDFNAAIVSKINITTGVKVNYALGAGPSAIAFDNVTNSIWVVNGYGNIVSKVNIFNGGKTDYTFSANFRGIAFDNVTNSVWVTDFGASTVSKINITTGAKVDYPAGDFPQGIAFDNVTNSVWVTNSDSNAVSKINITTGAKVDYPAGDYPQGITFDNVTNSVWVVDSNSNAVSRINITTGARVEYPASGTPQGITFDNVTNSVWVGNFGGGSVSKIDALTGAKVDYITGFSSSWVTFDNVTNSIWVVGSAGHWLRRIVATPGIFESAIIDTGRKASFTTINVTANTPANTFAVVDVRAGNTGDSSDGSWTAWQSDVHNDGDISVLSGNQYVQYRITLSTGNEQYRPVVSNIALNYTHYPTGQYVVSSPFNTANALTILSKLKWDVATSSQDNPIAFQIRTAADDNGIPGVWSDFVGPDSTPSSYFTAADGSDVIPGMFSDGADDQWLQYKMFLNTDANESTDTTLTGVQMTYGSNERPEFDQSFGTGGVLVTQISDQLDPNVGKLLIQYRIKDADTNSGSVTPGFITPSFSFNIPGWGEFGTPADPAYLQPTDLENKAVAEDEFTTYSAIYDFSYRGGFPADGVTFKVTISDNEANNAVAEATSNSIRPDYQRPDYLFTYPFLTGGLKEHFQFNEGNGSIATDAMAGATANLTNTSWTTGVCDNAGCGGGTGLHFNGSNSYAQFAGPIQFDQKNNFTIGWWAKMDYQDGQRAMISGDEDDTFMFYPGTNDGVTNNLAVMMPEFWGNPLVGTTNISDNQWHYLAVTYNGSAIKVYVDGNLEGSREYGNYFIQPTAWSLGRYLAGAQYFGGDMDDVTIYNRALTRNEINDSKWSLDIGGGDKTIVDAEKKTIKVGLWDKEGSNVFYRISNNEDFSPDGVNAISGIWQDAGTSTVNVEMPWNFTGGPYAKVFTESKDAFNNTGSETMSIPDAPKNIIIRDTSNVKEGNFQELISWNPYEKDPNGSEADFLGYNIFRSTDGQNFLFLAGINNQTENKYTDAGLSTSTTYYYKVQVQTKYSGSVSAMSEAVSDIPDGQGGTDVTPPTLSSVATAEAQATWAKIAWTTDELSDSLIEYAKVSDGGYGLSKSSTAMVVNHSVIIDGLEPNTTYTFRVTSKDLSENAGVNDNGGAGYQFTTGTGPSISGATVINITDHTASVVWNTNKDANSFVYYSTSSDLSAVKEVGSIAMIGGSTSTNTFAHQIDLTGLMTGTTYYYYVKSTDSGDTASIDNNNGQYYYFRTTNDTQAPIISNITTPLIAASAAVISWKTNEPATTQVEIGSAAGVYGTATELDETLSTYHVASISGLSPVNTYHYHVRSKDAAGNEAISSDKTLTTAKDMEIKIVTIGGGSEAAATPAIKVDTTPPAITNIQNASTTAFKTTISFDTDEPTLGFVSYGKTTEYGAESSDSTFSKSHSITLTGLTLGTKYNFKVKATDKSGNAASSANDVFMTKFFAEDIKDLTAVENTAQYQAEIEKSIESITPSILPPFVEAPVVSGITEDAATITWKTNVNSYSIVSYVPDTEYDAKNISPYKSEASDIENKTTSHSITLTGLTPNTTYHFMAKSFSLPKVMGKSDDMAFTTKASKVQASITDIKNTSFRAVWSTIEPATSIVEYTNAKTGIMERITDNKQVTYHDIVVQNIAPATTYTVRVLGYNEKGNVLETGAPVSVYTTKDIAAPKITNFKVDGALIPGRTDKVQTVITWTTDEPSNSTVFYQEGAGKIEGEFENKYEQLDNYTNTHAIILSDLKPGIIYQMRIESVDIAGNKAVFGPRTIITPQKTESIFDVIFKNFEDTFKFLRSAGQ